MTLVRRLALAWATFFAFACVLVPLCALAWHAFGVGMPPSGDAVFTATASGGAVFTAAASGGAVFTAAASGGAVFTAAASGGAVYNDLLWSVVRMTAMQAGWSAILSLVIGLPSGLLVGQAHARGARGAAIAHSLLMIPYALPTTVVAVAWTAWLGKSGLLSSLEWGYSLRAVWVAHVFLNAPWIAGLVAEARAGIPTVALEAARTLGAGKWARFKTVIYPFIAPAALSAVAQVFSVCCMSFAIVMILGGGPPVETLETSIYSQLRSGDPDLAAAVGAASMQVVLALTPWTLVALVSRSSKWRRLTHETRSHRRARSGSRGWKLSSAAFVAALAFLIPYLAILPHPGDGASLPAGFFAGLVAPIRVSLILAAIAATLATLTAIAALVTSGKSSGRSFFWAQIVAALLAIPTGTSTLVLGLGAYLAYARWIDPFDGSLTAIAALQATVILPTLLRMLWPAARARQSSALEAARTLGAGPLRAFFTVEWPRWKRPLVGAWALAAAVSIGEVAAASLFGSERLSSLPLYVSRLASHYEFEQARAVALVLAALSIALILLVRTDWRLETGITRGASR